MSVAPIAARLRAQSAMLADLALHLPDTDLREATEIIIQVEAQLEDLAHAVEALDSESLAR